MSYPERIHKVRTVTTFFSYWQGLRLVPVGVFLVVDALFISPLLPEKGPVFPILLAMLAATLLFSKILVGGYYRNMYGMVSNPQVNRRLDTITVLIAAPLITASLLLDYYWQGPLFVSGVVWGTAAWAYQQATGGLRSHWAGFAMALALLVFLPWAGLSFEWMVSILMAAVGVGYIVCGLLDHRELTRILLPIQEDRNDPA